MQVCFLRVPKFHLFFYACDKLTIHFQPCTCMNMGRYALLLEPSVCLSNRSDCYIIHLRENKTIIIAQVQTMRSIDAFGVTSHVVNNA